jgi:putative peptidoglycan lipid II flippase
VFVVTLLGIALAPAIIYVTAPGFSGDPEKFDLTVTMLRICFPYILCLSLVALAAGVLNTWNRFSIPALTPVLLNVAMIAAALVASRWFAQPVVALAWGVLLGGVLQLLLQIPFLADIGLLPRLSLNLKASFADEGVRRVLRQMGPAVIGVSVGQISLVINTIFASFLAVGSVSWLYYADRLMEFPSGMLGVALGTILLPSLSKHHANNAGAEYSQLLDWGLRLTLLLALPASVAFMILSIPLITTLFQYHSFTAADTLQSSYALLAYSVGLPALILVKVLAPGFYARQNIRTPVKIAVATLVITQLMNLALVPWIKHAGLALSISLGATFNATLLFAGLRRRKIYSPQPGWPAFALKALLGLAAMAAALALTMGATGWWTTVSWTERVPRLALVITAGGLAYFCTLWLLGFRPRDFSRKAA